MSKNKKPVSNVLVDIALLTCGLVEPQVFRDCVSAIKREMQTVDSRLHVIFNGVSKENRQTFQDIVYTVQSPVVKHSSERLGFAAGANRVVRQGTAPLVLFITDDVILHEGTLEVLVRRMDNPEIALCGLKLVFPKDSTDPTHPAGRVQHIGHAVDIRGEVTHPLIGWTPENPKCNISRELLSVTGGVFMVRRSVFMKAGGFFEGYGIGYFEDVDLCFTIRERNLGKIWIDTQATATHVTNASMSKAHQEGKLPSLDQNKQLFRMRKGHLLQQDSWSFW